MCERSEWYSWRSDGQFLCWLILFEICLCGLRARVLTRCHWHNHSWLGHTPEQLRMISIRGSLNTSLSYHNTSQPTETAPSTREMQFHPLNLSVQGLKQEWEDRLYLRFDSEPYSSDYNAATGRLSHARTNFLQWHFNRQFLFATQICSNATL